MCRSKYNKILVGDGDERLILCRKEDAEKIDLAELVKKAFPELFADLNDDESSEIKFRVECCHKKYSSKFDCQVSPLQNNNNWDEFPFMALTVFERDEVTYCRAISVDVWQKQKLS